MPWRPQGAGRVTACSESTTVIGGSGPAHQNRTRAEISILVSFSRTFYSINGIAAKPPFTGLHCMHRQNNESCFTPIISDLAKFFQTEIKKDQEYESEHRKVPNVFEEDVVSEMESTISLRLVWELFGPLQVLETQLSRLSNSIRIASSLLNFLRLCLLDFGLS